MLLNLQHLLHRREEGQSEQPPEQHNRKCHQRHLHPLSERNTIPLAIAATKALTLTSPFVSDAGESHRIIGHDGIDIIADAPAHEDGIVDGPNINETMGLVGIAHKAMAQRTHEQFLIDIERDVGRLVRQKLSRIADVKADQRDWNLRYKSGA